MKEYEIKYTTPDMAVGCVIRTNAELLQVNQLIADEVERMRDSNGFIRIEDMATGLISNVKAIKIVGFTVKELRPEPTEIDAEDIEDGDTEETL